MIKNKKALETNQEHISNSNNSILAQWYRNCNEVYRHICDVCENGTFEDLINLRLEIVSEQTNNKYNLMKIDKAIKERLER